MRIAEWQIYDVRVITPGTPIRERRAWLKALIDAGHDARMLETGEIWHQSGCCAKCLARSVNSNKSQIKSE